MTRGFSVAVLFATAACANFARADIIVAINMGFSPPNTATRFRESDGAPLVHYHLGAETTAGMSFGPDGNLYMAGNILGSGDILGFNAATGATAGMSVNFGQDGYQSPHTIAF